MTPDIPEEELVRLRECEAIVETLATNPEPNWSYLGNLRSGGNRAMADRILAAAKPAKQSPWPLEFIHAVPIYEADDVPATSRVRFTKMGATVYVDTDGTDQELGSANLDKSDQAALLHALAQDADEETRARLVVDLLGGFGADVDQLSHYYELWLNMDDASLPPLCQEGGDLGATDATAIALRRVRVLDLAGGAT